jgi:hypothetical protein
MPPLTYARAISPLCQCPGLHMGPVAAVEMGDKLGSARPDGASASISACISSRHLLPSLAPQMPREYCRLPAGKRFRKGRDRAGILRHDCLFHATETWISRSVIEIRRYSIDFACYSI